MYKRLIISGLEHWKTKDKRKPLILQGVRQTGKTSIVEQFAIKFDHFINLNLDFPKNRESFEKAKTSQELIDSILFDHQIDISNESSILIFIDEIQESAAAVKWLRYFYEDFPELYVIAAGSLLQKLLNSAVHFPLGRVEYLQIHP